MWPPLIQFFSFSCSFRQKCFQTIHWGILLCSWRPLLGSPGSVTDKKQIKASIYIQTCFDWYNFKRFQKLKKIFCFFLKLLRNSLVEINQRLEMSSQALLHWRQRSRDYKKFCNFFNVAKKERKSFLVRYQVKNHLTTEVYSPLEHILMPSVYWQPNLIKFHSVSCFWDQPPQNDGNCLHAVMFHPLSLTSNWLYRCN